MSLYSFSVFVALSTLSWHAFCSRDGEDSGHTSANDGTGAESTDTARHDVALTSDVSEVPAGNKPEMNPLEAVEKMGMLVQKAEEQKQRNTAYLRKTAGIAKALNLLVDAKRKVTEAQAKGNHQNISLSSLMSEDFGESLRSALEEAGARSKAVKSTAWPHPEEAVSSLVQVHTSAIADSTSSTSSDFSDLVKRVKTAAIKIESDAAALHGTYRSRNIVSLNRMLASLTQAAQFVHGTTDNLVRYPPSSAAEVSHMSKFLHEAENNMAATSKQLAAMKGRLADIDQHKGWLAAIDKQLGKQHPEASLLALSDSPSKRAIDAHEQTLDDSSSHQSDPKLASVLNRQIGHLTHAIASE